MPLVGSEVTEKYDPERPSISDACKVPDISVSSSPTAPVSPRKLVAVLGRETLKAIEPVPNI